MPAVRAALARGLLQRPPLTAMSTPDPVAPPSAERHAAVDRFRTETRLEEGAVPDRLPGATFETEVFALAPDGFLLNLPNGLSFHHRVGHGVTVARRAAVGDAELELFFNGSVCAAVAWLNGLVPIHASAVVHDEGVIAATGDSGAGKSTLIAGLCARGHPMQADDLLVLDLSDDGPPTCLPGGKTLKLWDDAFAMTGAQRRHEVRPGVEKFYARPAGGRGERPAPLTRVYFIAPSTDDALSIREISGISALERAPSLLFRPHFYGPVATPERHWSIVTGLCRRVRFFEFSRPMDAARFADGLDLLESHFRSA